MAAMAIASGNTFAARSIATAPVPFAHADPRAHVMTTRSDVANARLLPLLVAARAGDTAAYNAFLSELSVLLRPFLRRHLRRHDSDIEDVLQNVLLAIHTHRENYDASRRPLTAWVYAMTRYKLIDHLRREGLRAHIALDGIDDLFATETADAGDIQRDLDRLVGQLPGKQREAIQLVKIEERSLREAATATGLSETAVKVNVHRAIKNLMRFVARDESK